MPRAPLRASRTRDAIEDAVAGVDWVQENLPEQVEVKREVFRTLDAHAPAAAVLASSTSAIPASQFTEALAGRARCLVAHPVNPPHLVPVVELCGAPWTGAATIERARAVMTEVGQVPDRRAPRARRLHPEPPAGRAALRGDAAGGRGLRVAGGPRQDDRARPGPALVVHGTVRDHRAERAGRRGRLLRALQRLLSQARRRSAVAERLGCASTRRASSRRSASRRRRPSASGEWTCATGACWRWRGTSAINPIT